MLRGSGFAFHRRARAAAGGDASPSASSALSSLLTPFFMGTVVGAIASGRVPVGNAEGDPVTSWLNGVSLLIGALFVATCAYLAAVFLVSDARRARRRRPRALLHARARSPRRWWPERSRSPGSSSCAPTRAYLYDGLTGEALPL